MGAATIAEDKKQDSASDPASVEPPQWTPSTFAPSGRGAWGDSSNDSGNDCRTPGAPSGMPLFLQRQVQMKCTECGKAEEEQHARPPVQAKCAACEEEGLKDESAAGSALDGVANANRPLPHLDRIQAAFGRHDVREARASVGGNAAEANERMGALAYTSGNRVAFRSEPDVNLAAHEAAHIVQQRNGAKLPGGVGRPGDRYEQQADAAAKAVERGESAEPVLDSGDLGGGAESAPALQHRLEVNASRMYEPAVISAAGAVGGMAASGGKGAASAPGKAAEKGAKPGDKSSQAETEDTIGSTDSNGGNKNAASGPAAQSGPSAAPPSAPAPAQSGAQSAGPAPIQAPAPDAGPPAGAAAPANSGSQAPPASATPGGASVSPDAGSPEAAPAPASAAAAPASPAPGAAPSPAPGAQSGASCTPACYHEPSEDPPDTSSDEAPPNPPAGQSEEQTSEGDEQDLPEPDDCSAQEGQAGVTGAAQSASAASAGSTGAGPGASGPESPGGAASAAPAGPAAQSGPASAPAAGGPVSSAASSGGDRADAAETGGKAAGASPLDGPIAQSEGQRSAAVASYEGSAAAIEGAAANTTDLRNGAHFAAAAAGGSGKAAQREAAEARANRFFSNAADGLGQAIAFASSEAPDQLGAQAEASKAQILASAETQKGSISARIQTARDEARADAAIARRAVIQQSESFVTQAQSAATGAVAALTAAHAATMGQVDAHETATLDQVNQIYANGRPQLEGLGVLVGGECTAIGDQFAAAYEGFEHCTENGFWDGDLSERRAQAQAEAAHKTAKGYHDRMVDAAKKRAREVAKNGRKNNRCAVIASARNAREMLDQQLAQLTGTIESARDHAIEQADGTRVGLLSSIDGSLTATLRQFDRQEHEQLQTIDDTCYLQQVLQEQMAHAAAASLQRVVTGVASSLQDTLFALRQQFASSAAPDPAALDQALSDVSQRIDAALGGLQNGLLAGTAAAVQQLDGASAQGLAALDAVTASNDEMTAALSGGFGSSMGAIAGQDNFASQRAGFVQMTQQAATGGSAALQQVFGGMRDACGKITADSLKSLTQAAGDLEKNLRQSKQGIECQITREADEAASHEAPAWKRLIAVLLVIIVIVIVIAVTVLTAGMALGPLAMIGAGILIGAAVGAVTSGLIAMAGNLWSNQSVMKGVGHAVLVGAITGAIGGGIGAGAGLAFKGASVAVQFAATMVTSAAIDVGTQFVMGGLSFKNFSWSSLGITLVVTALTFGLAHQVSTARAAGVPAGEGGGARVPEGVGESVPAPNETASAPPENAATPEKPAAPPEAPPEATSPAPTPEEKVMLESTANKGGDELSPSEVTAERQIASKSNAEPIDDPPFTTERELPNGHKIRETADGKICERCSGPCGVYNEQGELIGEVDPPAGPKESVPEAPEELPTAPKEGEPTANENEDVTPTEDQPGPTDGDQTPAETPEEKPSAPEGEGEEPKPWEEEDNVRRYKGYKSRLKNRLAKQGKPPREPLEPKDWWEQIGSKDPHNPAGPRGNDDHNDMVLERFRLAQQEFAEPPGRYIVRTDEYIPEVPGLREKPDVSVYDTQEQRVVKVEEVARFGKRGGLVRPDEKVKIQHYQEKGIPSEFFPVKGGNAPKGGTLKPPLPAPPAGGTTTETS